MRVTCQSAALCKSVATSFGCSKKCEMGMPMNIVSHVGLVAKAVGTFCAAQDMCKLFWRGVPLDSVGKDKMDSLLTNGQDKCT